MRNKKLSRILLCINVSNSISDCYCCIAKIRICHSVCCIQLKHCLPRVIESVIYCVILLTLLCVIKRVILCNSTCISRI